MFEHARIHRRAVGLHDPAPLFGKEVVQDRGAASRREPVLRWTTWV
jgi:hypothetical protein